MSTVEGGRAAAQPLYKRFTSNFSWTVVSVATGRGVFFFTNIYLARLLGTRDFGLFVLAQSVTLYFWLVVDLGTNMYGIREIARNRENAQEIINPLLTMRLVAGLAAFSVYMAAVFFLDAAEGHRPVFFCCGLYLLTYSFQTDWVLKGLEKFEYIAIGSIVSSVAFLAGIIFFLRPGSELLYAAFFWSGSFFLGGATLLYVLWWKLGLGFRPDFRISVWIMHLRESLYFTVSGALTGIYQYLPIFLLSMYFGLGEVGLFSAPYKIVITICTAGFMIPTAFYPIFSDLYGSDPRAFIKTHRAFQLIMLVIGLPVGIAGTFFGDELVWLLLGVQYTQSTGVFVLLVWLVPMYFLRYTYGSVLIAAGFQKSNNHALFIGVMAAVAAGLVLIPRMGITGAALALLFAETFNLFFMALFFKFRFLHLKEKSA